MAEIVLKHFTVEDAFALGLEMHTDARALKLPIVIDIRAGDAPLFSVMLPGASGLNFDWARRKRNLTLLTEKASWHHSQNLANGEDVIASMALNPRDYTAHGGCVPVFVEGAGLVATVTISGLPQKEDHEFAMKHLEPLAAEQVQAKY